MSHWSSRTSRVRGQLPLDTFRRASDYLWPRVYSNTAKFNAADALSLGTLVARSRGGYRPHADFYEAAYRSVSVALNLEEPMRLVRWLRRPRCAPAPSGEVAAVLQLIRVREAFIATQNEYGEMLEGDRWGLHRRGRAPLAGEVRTAVEGARRWYGDTCDRLITELPRVDAGLCAILGWDLEASTTLRTLRTRYAFPDVAVANGDL